ncbi:phosphatidate phosphatase LPIN3-like [Montipora capricornis]|uniref:phosphatidate phosphatase LPIN3-like n=1 Tax=Montipora capricornis TaxID=246305 RepID=UPI0035F1512E
MNYFGRLVSNVRGFYSEINSATLTGAIDVVVVRREDGSFVGSPFHVRFGKLGVLRSREKIVDIEINGEPVELQMKLGEAGEAFFVEELENDLSDGLGSSLPSSERLEPNKKDHGISHEENRDNSAVCLEDSTSRTGIKLSETSEREASTISMQTDQDQEGLEGKDGAANDSGTDEKSDSQMMEVQSDSTKEDNHSDPETGEMEESLSSSIKEPASVDATDNRKISTEIELESSLEIGIENCTPKTDSIPIPVRAKFELHEYLSDSETMWRESRSTSSSGFSRDFYPLSDMDSPIGSPPTDSEDLRLLHIPEPERYMSDSEVELKQSQESIARENEIRWAWGKLPQGPEGSFLPDRKPSEMRKEDIKHVHKMKRREAALKSHHKSGGKEGILLDDLRTVDHEVAALYLHQALDSSLQQQQSGSGSEDRESGIGQSLPCSPTCAVGERSKDTGLEEYHDIAMSLCGDLKNGKVALESFIQSMVTFDDLSNNPALLSDPKLVIRINDRYYNWQIAAPMLMSHVIFQRPLKQETCQSLIKQHMPKKEKRRSYRNMYYWFSWRANEEKSSDEENEDLKKDRPRLRINSSNSRKQANVQETEEDGKTENQKSERQRKISEYNSGNESDIPKRNYRKVTRLSSGQIKSLNLKDGANSITFSVTTKYQGTAMCTATIYMWNYDDKIVISDIDGTITKSDVLGQILPAVGQAWAQSGVAQFFGKIQQNGYKVLYLSARAIGQAQQTRDYLKSVKQDQLMLPDGPLLLSPESLIKAFHREVIEKKPEEFKIACLRDIQSLFPTNRNPFYAGFGNKVNDVLSYRAVGIAVSRIFTINHRGEVRHDLTNAFQTSYMKLSDLVDQMFPTFKTEPSGLIAPDQFSSFTYWRAPLPNITLDDLDETGDDSSEATASSKH